MTENKGELSNENLIKFLNKHIENLKEQKSEIAIFRKSLKRKRRILVTVILATIVGLIAVIIS